jgi:CPA2 family monovalent cation:H+ antiporter-2
MAHEPVLIATIAIGLTLAFILGMACRRLGLPALIGYLLAGVLVGPHTVGYVADAAIAAELAEIGVILLMFGVGIHFSMRDLLAVGPVAIPGAIAQSLVATLVGTGVGVLMGWGVVGGMVLGLSISVASTVVLLRALIERGELDSVQGRVAVGWLIAEDLLTVVILVLLPSIAPLLTGSGGGSGSAFGPLGDLAGAILATVVFAAIMLVAGTRLAPRILDRVALEHSREMFTLAVVALALGVAYVGYVAFGVSLALGGFLAGAVVNESDLSHQASADAQPLQDSFSVLFFVSVGMLVDPAWILAHPLPVIAVTLVVMGVKAVTAYGIVAALGYPSRVGVTVAAALSQVGEFSFILITLGVQLQLVPADALQVVVAAALVSITLNPVMFRLVDPVVRALDGLPLPGRLSGRSTRTLATIDRPRPEALLRGHAVVCGHGRVGRLVTSALDRRSFPYVVITNDRYEAQRLRGRGTPVLSGDAAIPALLDHARIREARVLVVALRDGHAARLVVDRARELAPRVSVVVRTHSERERDVLQGMGDTQAVLGELEVAVQMTRYALTRFGVSMREAEAIAQGLRGRGDRAAGPRRPGPVGGPSGPRGSAGRGLSRPGAAPTE